MINPKFDALSHMIKFSFKNFVILIAAVSTVWLMLGLFSFILAATGESNPQYQMIFSDWILKQIAVHLEMILVFVTIAITLPVIFQE